MIANRITSRVTEEFFQIDYYLDDAKVLTLNSDYSVVTILLKEGVPFTASTLFDIILVNNSQSRISKDLVHVELNQQILQLELKTNLFDYDFSLFNGLIFGLHGVSDFIFNNEALESLIENL